MQDIIDFLASEKWARVLGSLVAIATLATILFQIFKNKKVTTPDSSVDYELVRIWGQLHPDMQDAFVLANNERKRLGHDKLHTELLFKALVRLGNSDLVKIFQKLPEGSLPTPVEETNSSNNTLFEDKPVLSGCVQDSMSSYLKLSNIRRDLTPSDIFIDIGKHGTGRSVARLRDHGVDEDELEKIAGGLGYDLVRRENVT